MPPPAHHPPSAWSAFHICPTLSAGSALHLARFLCTHCGNATRGICVACVARRHMPCQETPLRCFSTWCCVLLSVSLSAQRDTRALYPSPEPALTICQVTHCVHWAAAGWDRLQKFLKRRGTNKWRVNKWAVPAVHLVSVLLLHHPIQWPKMPGNDILPLDVCSGNAPWILFNYLFILWGMNSEKLN